jgi:hypothetical protein
MGADGLLSQLGPVLGLRIYKGTKALYLPLSRAVDVDTGIIPGGWALAEDSTDFKTAIDKVFDWSNWTRDGVLYIHYGAMYGVTVLRVADLRVGVDTDESGRIVIKVNDPCCVLLIPSGQYDNSPRLAIYVEERTDVEGKPYEYAEVIDAAQVRTFEKGQPAPVDGRPAEYPNALGFVPFVEVRHIETGEPLGECTYQKATSLLDELNQLASYLADIIAKHAEPQWAIIGAEPSDMVKSGDNVWFIPQGGDAKALVAAIDIKGVLEFIQDLAQGVKGALPELAFDELKAKDNIATATVELQLMELTIKIKRCRPNYDHGLADALRMAGRAAALMGIGDIASLDDEGLRFDPERPVIPLDKMSQIMQEQAQVSLDQQKAIDPQKMAQAQYADSKPAKGKDE